MFRGFDNLLRKILKLQLIPNSFSQLSDVTNYERWKKKWGLKETMAPYHGPWAPLIN